MNKWTKQKTNKASIRVSGHCVHFRYIRRYIRPRDTHIRPKPNFHYIVLCGRSWRWAECAFWVTFGAEGKAELFGRSLSRTALCNRLPDTSATRHFGIKTLWDTSAPVSRHFDTKNVVRDTSTRVPWSRKSRDMHFDPGQSDETQLHRWFVLNFGTNFVMPKCLVAEVSGLRVQSTQFWQYHLSVTAVNRCALCTKTEHYNLFHQSVSQFIYLFAEVIVPYTWH